VEFSSGVNTAEGGKRGNMVFEEQKKPSRRGGSQRGGKELSVGEARGKALGEEEQNLTRRGCPYVNAR